MFSQLYKMVKITTTAFIFHKDKVLFVFHKKLNMWMHVGGHVKNNEFFDEALKREIKEEVNLDVSILTSDEGGLPELEPNMVLLKKPIFIHGTIKNGKKDIALDYICLAKEPVNIKLKNDELKNFKWATQEEIKDLDISPLLKKLTSRAFKKYKKFSNPR